MKMEHKEELKEFRKLESKGDLWGILGVCKDATQKEIKSGYVKLYKKYKPLQEEEAAEILLIVNKAYKTLKDPKAVEEHCKRAYIQKEVDEFFKGVTGIGRIKEKIVDTLISDGEISGMDCAVLKNKGKSYLTDKIANELNPLDVYITKDEYRQGYTETFIEQHSSRKVDVRIPAYTEDGKIIAIEGGKHFARVEVIPIDVDEIFEKIVEKVSRKFQIDLGELTSTQETKDFIRGNAKEQYRKDKRVNEQEIIEKVLEPLDSLIPKIEPFDVYITKDEYREGCTVTLVGQQPHGRSRKIDVRIPAKTKNGEIIQIEGGKVRVNVVPTDAYEIFEKIVEKVRRKFHIDLDAVAYKVKSEMVGFIRNQVKEQYRKDKRVNEQEIIEKVIRALPVPGPKKRQEYPLPRYEPSEPTTVFNLAKRLIYLLIKYWWVILGLVLFWYFTK
jgi:DnaJ-class molecular chaperone